VYVCILPEKAVPKMTYTVSGWMLNPTHSLTHCSVHFALIVMLTNEPEMQQLDAFCDHKMQQNASVAIGGAYCTPPDLVVNSKGPLCGRKGKGKGERKVG